MAPSTRTEPAGDDRGLVAWIDRALEEGRPVLEVAAELARNALPAQGGQVTPFVYGSEGWFWSWNRAGFGYIERARYDEAATIFTAAYLSALRFQDDFQERLHKGTPLCNISYSYLRAKETTRARIPAALGVIEDTLTFADPKSQGNAANLRASGYGESRLQDLVGYTEEFFRARGQTPLYPEVVLRAMKWETFVNTNAAPQVKAIVEQMQQVASGFQPDSLVPSIERLRRAWAALDELPYPSETHRGDLAHARVESSAGVGPDTLTGTATVSGTNAIG